MKICSTIMWNNSVIFRECLIDNKCLPHGSVDIVCGRLGTEDISIKLSVMVDKHETTIDNPQLVSAKTRFSLKTKELSKCQCQQHVCV